MAPHMNNLDIYESKDSAFEHEVMDSAIAPTNEYEYCSLDEELENITDPDWNQLKPDYIHRFPAKSMLRVIGLLREKEIQNKESKKQNTKIEKIEFNKIEWNKTQCEVTNLNEVIENEKDKDNWITVSKKEKIENIKTEMCKSFKKYICRYNNNCRFAHSLSELVITDCKFGKNCKAVNYIEKSKTYRNNRKKDKVCSKKHPSESNENVHSRLGLVGQKKVTKEEMDITESYIENFEKEVLENKTSIAKTINGKIKYLPRDRFVKYELETPLNIVSISFYGFGHKFIQTPKITIKKKEVVAPSNDSKKQLKIEEIRNKIKKNTNIIERFASRVDNSKCQQECSKLRNENEQLERQIIELEKKPVVTVVEKKVPVIVSKKPEPVVTVTIVEKKVPVMTEKKPFNLEAKSFISVLNVVSIEPSQKCCHEVKPKTVLKTELCRSVGKYVCSLGNNCKFAHNTKELTVLKCSYGNRCFDIECIDGTYVNKKNMKNRICQRQHPEETLDNLHKRLTVEKENKEKSELCKSFGKYNCHHGKTCRYAHSLKELNVIKCRYGNRCFDVDCIGTKYVNRKNIKNRVCQRQHEGETIENVHYRLSRKM